MVQNEKILPTQKIKPTFIRFQIFRKKNLEKIAFFYDDNMSDVQIEF